MLYAGGYRFRTSFWQFVQTRAVATSAHCGSPRPKLHSPGLTSLILLSWRPPEKDLAFVRSSDSRRDMLPPLGRTRAYVSARYLEPAAAYMLAFPYWISMQKQWVCDWQDVHSRVCRSPPGITAVPPSDRQVVHDAIYERWGIITR